MPTGARRATVSTRARRDRRRRIAEAKQRLRELRIELSVLNHRIGSRAEIKDVDLDCLDVITNDGPINPTVIARRLGVHLATMTGILDRLERAGWVVRERDAGDRRAVVVRGVPDKQREIFRLYDGMDHLLDEILDSYSDEQIGVIADFLRRCTEAGHTATARLASGRTLA